MRTRVALLTVLLVFSASAVAGVNSDNWHQEGIELQKGESQELGDYVFRYSTSGVDPRLELIHRDDGSRTILAQYTEDEIIESEDNISYISGDRGIGFDVTKFGYDEGLFVNLSVSSREDIFSDSELTTTAPDHLIARRNGEIDVPLTLENNGVANETYQLTTLNSSRLTVKYGYDSFNVSELMLEPGDSQELDAVIDIPESASKGMHEVTLVARGSKDFTVTVNVEVRGEEKERRLEIDLDQNFKSIKSGEKVNVPVTVINRGEVELQDVNVTSTLPEGWDKTIRPQLVDSLRPRYGRERVTVSVSPPEDVEPGDYFVELSAHSPKVGVQEPAEVRIHVREKSGLAWVGIAVMAFSVLLLVLVQRRFKRR
jgi:uncharacterized membrane protein